MIGLLLKLATKGAGLFGFSLSPFAAGALLMAAVSIGIGGGLTWFGVHQFNKGVSQERAKCQADKLQSQLNAAHADLQAARNAAAFSAAKVKELDADVAAEKKRSEDYAEALKKRPAAPGCTLTDDDLRRLWPAQRRVR